LIGAPESANIVACDEPPGAFTVNGEHGKMSSITNQLDEILQTIKRPGDFYVSGTSEVFAPSLDVTGVGTIALPLLPVQAEQLISVAERAPYGRGSDTLVDTNVRRTWQIGADRVRLKGRHWDSSLSSIVTRCAAGLGVAEPVTAELYKMLVYDTGSFFVGHRDTEKAPGMFATLVVVLPSRSTGGELFVRHRDREVCLDLASEDASEVAFAAFYADCVHEVSPVTTGCRLVLVYNLIRQKSGRAIEPPAYDAEEELVTDVLRRWVAAQDTAAADAPKKLIYPLEHVYTPAEIGFSSLKNADAARAAVLMEAATRAQCDLHLALITIEETGTAEFAGRWSRGGRYAAQDDDFEVGEVCERTLNLSDWQRPDGGLAELPDLPFDDAELCPPDAFEDEAPDEQLFFEATGNAGASFERSYRRAALVLWPQTRRLDIIATGGLAVSLPYLATLVHYWTKSGDETGSPTWHEANRLARLILNAWPIRGDEPGGGPGTAARMLMSLSDLHDIANITTVLSDLIAKGCYAESDNQAVARAAALLPLHQAADLLERIITRNAPWQAPACADLLARITLDAATHARDDAAVLFKPAALTLLAALPSDSAPTPAPHIWPRPAPLTPALIVDLLFALHLIDAVATVERAVARWLASPVSFSPDTILVPAMLRLAERDSALRDWAPVTPLRDACLAHLDRRIAEPLAPPADFVRPSAIACRCGHCTELSAFLADPVRKLWVFRAAEANRRHVEDSIRRSDCDVVTETDRVGRPYALVCTKNKKSYQRRVAQRKKDLEDRARLGSE